MQKYCQINMLIKTFWGLVEMMFWPVNVSFSLPEWQAVEITFFAPCRRWLFTRGFNCKALNGTVLVFWISGRLWEVVRLYIYIERYLLSGQ